MSQMEPKNVQNKIGGIKSRENHSISYQNSSELLRYQKEKKTHRKEMYVK